MRISREWNFGEDRELANQLKELVLSGRKKASTGLYNEQEKIPQVGDYEAILDSDKRRFCIIRCTGIEIRPLIEVDYEYVIKEGEGDKDVEDWREKHRRFFKLKDDSVKVVCEEFEVISRM